MWFSQVFVVALSGAIVLQWWLNQRQLRHIARFRAEVPAAFSDKISLQAHQKAADYTSAKIRVGQIEVLYSTALLLFWTLGGGLNWLNAQWSQWSANPLWQGVGFIISMMLISSLLDIPFSLYRTFVIEARFGFNRTRPLLFITDLLKGIGLTLAIGIPLLWLVLWLMQSSGALWWVYVWAVFMGFSLIMLFVYPTWIAPLFNKFAPLEDAELRVRIENLLTRCGFTSKGIFVMDGSRRSSHGNAYFTGLGDNKRIVFFDTLLKSLQAKEIEAVLAHELGHFKRKHIQKQILARAMLTFVSLAILGLLINQPWFYLGLGITIPTNLELFHPPLHVALVLFMLLVSVFGVYLQPVFSYFSRRHEFEADDFAASQSDAQDLIRALVKMYEENASTLTPDPIYSAFHDSHPPAPVRIAHLSTKIHA